MNKHSLTSRDVATIAVVLMPLLIGAGMLAASLWSWRGERDALSDLVARTVGQGEAIDFTTLPRVYDQRTSDQHTAAWKTILSATEAHHARFGGPFAWAREDEGYEAIVRPGEDWPQAEIMSQYAEAAAPIVEKLETLLGSRETIWAPIVFASFRTNLHEFQQMRGVARLLHYCFLDAVHRGQNERAITLIQLGDRLFGADYQSTLMVDELIRIACFSVVQNDIRGSIAANIFADADRERLAVIVSKPQNWQANWENVIESEMLMTLPILAADDSRLLGMNADNAVLPLMMAPSSLRSFVSDQQTVAMIRGAGSKSHTDAVEHAKKERSRKPAGFAIDRWLQLPTLDPHWMTSSMTPAYEAMATALRRSANETRFTQTTLALREFRVEFGQWPPSLDELSRIGLPESTIMAGDGSPFAYQVNSEDQAILRDQTHPHRSFIGLDRREAEGLVLVP